MEDKMNRTQRDFLNYLEKVGPSNAFDVAHEVRMFPDQVWGHIKILAEAGYLTASGATVTRTSKELPELPAPVIVARKGKKVCARCGGQGFIQKFKHIDGGQCFDCSGTGEAR